MREHDAEDVFNRYDADIADLDSRVKSLKAQYAMESEEREKLSAYFEEKDAEQARREEERRKRLEEEKKEREVEEQKHMVCYNTCVWVQWFWWHFSFGLFYDKVAPDSHVLVFLFYTSRLRCSCKSCTAITPARKQPKTQRHPSLARKTRVRVRARRRSSSFTFLS